MPSPAADVRQGGIASRIGATLRERHLAKHVLMLMSGSVAAQGLTLLLAPLLTRLYKPEDFGVLALFTTVLFVSAPLVSARYDMAIVPAESDSDAFGLLVLSCLIATACGMAGLCLAIGPVARIPAISPLVRYLALLPAGIAVNGYYQALRQFCVREKLFKNVSFSQITQSSGSSVTPVLTASFLPEAWGLLVGQTLGLTLSSITLGRRLVVYARLWLLEHRGRHFGTLRRLAVQYRRHPIYLPWAGLIDALAQRLPVLLLSGFYGARFLGLYAIADRMIRTPISLIGQNFAPVMFQRMSEPETKRGIPRLLWKWGLGMSALFLLPAGALFLGSKFLFAVIFGKRWAEAGNMSVDLIPIYWGSLVVAPVSGLLIIAKRQGTYLTIQILFLITGFSSLWLSHSYGLTGENTLLVYTSTQFLVYLIYFGSLFVAGRGLSGGRS